MKRILFPIALLITAITGSVLFRATTLKSLQFAPESVTFPEVPAAAVGRLSDAIKLKTISPADPKDFDGQAFLDLHKLYAQAYPLVHQKLSLDVVNKYSLLFTWKGTDPSLPAVLMMGHLDVVPIEPVTEKDWKAPPFGGVVKDGYIWGRGSIDDKMTVAGLLEAAEILLQSGFTPKRTIYFAFGHDEELSGLDGAKAIATKLKSLGAKIEYIVDEGLFILDGQMPGVSKPIAFVGVAEKGYMDLELSVRSKGGHSSQPPPSTAVGELSKAIAKLEDAPFPARFDLSVDSMFDYVAPEMSLPFKAVFANRWLFSPVIKKVLSASATTNALIRTTLAPTILAGSVKSNVLPQVAKAVVNVRLLPGDTQETAKNRVKEIIADPAVELKILDGANDPLSSGPINSYGFEQLHKAIRTVFPNVVVAPSLMIGGTDSKNYAEFTKNIYRFAPMQLSDDELSSFHGTNERLSVISFNKMVQFYHRLLATS